MSWSCPRCGAGRDNCECSQDSYVLDEILSVLIGIKELLKAKEREAAAADFIESLDEGESNE